MPWAASPTGRSPAIGADCRIILVRQGLVCLSIRFAIHSVSPPACPEPAEGRSPGSRRKDREQLPSPTTVTWQLSPAGLVAGSTVVVLVVRLIIHNSAFITAVWHYTRSLRNRCPRCPLLSANLFFSSMRDSELLLAFTFRPGVLDYGGTRCGYRQDRLPFSFSEARLLSTVGELVGGAVDPTVLQSEQSSGKVSKDEDATRTCGSGGRHSHRLRNERRRSGSNERQPGRPRRAQRGKGDPDEADLLMDVHH